MPKMEATNWNHRFDKMNKYSVSKTMFSTVSESGKHLTLIDALRMNLEKIDHEVVMGINDLHHGDSSDLSGLRAILKEAISVASDVSE
jgi:actin-like ATPase involved in cell morphogenesis